MKSITPFLILLLLAAGCVTHTDTVQTPYPPVERKTVVDKRVTIDPALGGAMRVVGVKSTQGNDGYLKIQIDVQSLLNSASQVNYKINWLDSDGADIPMVDTAPMVWMFLAHETSFLAVTAPTPAARDFHITFLGPNSGH